MKFYKNFVFEIYESVLNEEISSENRKRFLIDNVYTLLEKSNFPVKHSVISKIFDRLEEVFRGKRERMEVFPVFDQVCFIADSLKLSDFVIFKKLYDAYVESSLQISPEPYSEISRVFDLVVENGGKIFLICNTLQTTSSILRLTLKENHLDKYVSGIDFSEEMGVVFFNELSFEFFVKKYGLNLGESIFITNLKNSYYDRHTKIDLKVFKDRSEIYNLVVDLVENS